MPKNPKRVAAGRRAKRKGSGFENSLAKKFGAWWGHGEWARTPMSGGWGTKPVREGFHTCGDVITTALDFPFCVEAKKQEGWCLDQLLTAPKSALFQWWSQTREETPESLVPLLVASRNYHDPLVVTNSMALQGALLSLGIPHLLMREIVTHKGDLPYVLALSSLFSIYPGVFVDYQGPKASDAYLPQMQTTDGALPVQGE